MSCNLIKHCIFGNLKSLKQILFPDEKSEDELMRDEDWDNRWNWDSSDMISSLSAASSSRNESSLNYWLSHCLMSISPFGDVIAFAREKNLAIYRLKPELSSEKPPQDDVFLTCATTLIGLEPKETITCVLCLPLVSQQRSSGGSPDWTCIILGFSSGYIRIYTETGGLLLSQILHDESVISIKCQTFSPSSNADHDQVDEIYLVYSSAVVLIDGFALYQTLRSCRNQLAKAQSGSGGYGFGFMNNIADHTLPLAYKKWHLQSAEQIYDSENIGVHSRNLYDHLVSQSIYRGPYGAPKSNSPSANLLITTGDNPYIGFYRAHEGATHTILNEMANAVMNKVKNIIPISIFGSNKSQDETSKAKVEAATDIPLRLGLFDQNRDGLRINLSPDRRLAAVSDDFGRVTLIDVHKMIAVRMWKGYRDAEIGWVQVNEDKDEIATTKRALFLIIYAPKRGILEIWCCEMGPRVTAFNVGKSCKLIQCSYSMMGLNALMIKQYKSVAEFCQSRCFLFDYNSATIYTIHIPFLCALTDRNSKRTRDLHLVKELKNVIKENPIKHDKIVNILLSIKTANVRKEAIETIVQMNDIGLIKKSINEMKNVLLTSVKSNELDYDNQLIIQMCCRILQICIFYEKIIGVKSIKCSIVEESIQAPEIQELVEILNWKGSDIARCLSLLVYKHTIVPKAQLILNNDKHLNICQFLSYFTLYSNQLLKDKNNETIFDNILIEVKTVNEENLLFNYLTDVSNFIFLNYFLSNEMERESFLRESFIAPSNLLLLMFISWLSSHCCDYWKSWECLNNTLKCIVNMMLEHDANIIEDDENYLLSPSWKEVIDLIYDSSNVTASLIATHVIKSVIICKLKENDDKKLSQLGSDSEHEWETLSVDNEKLNMLIKQLEDMFLLQLLLKSCHGTHMEHFSLRILKRSGPGIVSELVAKWSINAGIKPEVLCSQNEENSSIADDDDPNDEQKNEMIALGEDVLQNAQMDCNTAKELLDHVRRCFPNCLEPDVLLANCAWESLVRWEKDPSTAVNNCLKESLSYLNYITSAVLKHNVACLMWKTFIQKRFETLAHLMEKMGKTPKERICKKELGMGENCLETFLDFSCEILEFILQTNMMAEIEPMPLFTHDDWWKTQNAISSSSSTTPLVILAVHQKVANAALVLEHSRLATVMLLIASFQLRSSRPLSLLSPMVQPYMFKDLHSFPVHASNSDPNLIDVRMRHLMNAVSAIAHSLPPYDKDHDSEEYISCQSKLHSQANKWFGKVITLTREWELNTDEVRRHFICELYSNGCDNLAEEVLTSVVNLASLGNQLLTIAGMRVIHAVNDKYGTIDQMHTLPPNVVFWLKSLNSDVQYYTGASLESTLTLLEHTNNYVYYDQNNGKICEALIDAIKTLRSNL